MDKDVHGSLQDDDTTERGMIFRGGQDLDSDVERARQVLSVVERVVRDDVSYRKSAGRDVESLDQSLGAAEHALRTRVSGRLSATGDTDLAQLLATLLQVGVVRSEIKDAMLTRQKAASYNVSKVLRKLRSFVSLSDLADAAPAQVHELGLRRVLLSRVESGQWLARSSSVVDDAELAQEMVRVGTANPGSLTGGMVETDMARRKEAILVRDAQRHPRVHRELRELINTHTYVGAPVLARGRIVGLLHADENMDTSTVDAFDREFLGLFAEGLGFAIERTIFFQRMQGMREKLEEHMSAVTELIDEFVESDVDLVSTEDSRSRSRSQARPLRGLTNAGVETAIGPLLTRREGEVLHRMALGETNAQIAGNLFVSEGTVKSHVKHILRKLGAANRAEAVSRYHLIVRGER